MASTSVSRISEKEKKKENKYTAEKKYGLTEVRRY